MDSTEAAADSATAPASSAAGDQREPEHNAVPLATDQRPSGNDPAERAQPEEVLGAAETKIPGEPASAGGTGALRPRRRRRRRRPGQAIAASADAGTHPEAAGPVTDAGLEALAPEVPAAQGGAAEIAAAGESVGAAEGAAPQRAILKLRNRRRRRRPAVLGLLPGHTDEIGPAEGKAGSEAGGGTRPALAPGQRSFSVPRRRRRHAPLAGAAPAPGAGPAAASAGAGEAVVPPEPRPQGEPGSGSRRPRSRRRRRAGPAAAATNGDASVQARESGLAGEAGTTTPGRRPRRGGPRQSEGERGREVRGPAAGERRGDRGGAASRDGRERGENRARGPGRGRGGPPRRIEQKLYSVDAIVDRGFEDLEQDGDTRRVHWTIVKRTTADQVSRKAVATIYVLQRDGSDTEFPNLGAARSAVNKTIVHPEKLTPSKAERAIAKK